MCGHTGQGGSLRSAESVAKGGGQSMNAASIAKTLFLVVVLLVLVAGGSPVYGAEQALSISQGGIVAAPSALLPVPTRGPAGTPLAWGDNSSGQGAVPADLSQAV